jgi:hypothetical protein
MASLALAFFNILISPAGLPGPCIFNIWQTLCGDVELGNEVLLIDYDGHHQATATAEFLTNRNLGPGEGDSIPRPERYLSSGDGLMYSIKTEGFCVTIENNSQCRQLEVGDDN